MKVYKKFFIKTLVLMLTMPLLLTGLSLLISNYFIGKEFIRYGESQMIHQWMTQKNEAVKNLRKKNSRIVFVSGSNALFGVNAKMIEEKTGIPTLNYASHAGLSTYFFYDAKRILKPNDIVFLPLEYDYYDDSYEINCLPSTLIEYVIAYDNEYFKQLPIKSKLKVLIYLVRLDSVIAIGKTIDRKYELNSRGDVLYGINLDKNYAKKAKPEKINVKKLSKNYKKWELYEFIQWCKLNHIRVYAFAPNLYHQPIASKKEQESFKQIKKFYNLAGVKFIGNFEDGFFDLKYMLNSNNHLNAEGRKIRSNYFIQKIKTISF